MVRIAWDMHRWETEVLFGRLFGYQEMMEERFARMRAVDKARVDQRPPQLSEEDFAEWRDKLLAHEERYNRDFPRNMRYSFVVLLQIIIETRLRAACDEISRRKRLQLTEGNLRGSAIDRARLFLSKVASLDVSNSQLWQQLTDLQKIRDCVVHANGIVADSRDSTHLRQVVGSKVGVSLDPSGALAIDQEYCGAALESARRFFEELFDSAGFGPAFPKVKEI